MEKRNARVFLPCFSRASGPHRGQLLCSSKTIALTRQSLSHDPGFYWVLVALFLLLVPSAQEMVMLLIPGRSTSL